MWPAPHGISVPLQSPAAQVWPVGQAMSQPPQLFGSVAGSAQVALKPLLLKLKQQVPGALSEAAQRSVSKVVQSVSWHWPPTQLSPLGQPPAPAQLVPLGMQTPLLSPSTQSPELHETLQPPQLPGSCVGSTQCPPQQRPAGLSRPKKQNVPLQLSGTQKEPSAQRAPAGQPAAGHVHETSPPSASWQ
jgi:hypothetical protein